MPRPFLVQRRLRSIVVVVTFASACSERDGVDEPVGSTVQTGEGSSEGSGGDDSSSGSGGSSSGEASSDASSGSGLEYACTQDAECRLHSDCCSCTAVHEDEPVPACNASCERNTCETWGITELLCAHTCHIRLLECDATLVACDEPPPTCDDGFSPTVADRCWTGYCVPLELCRP